MKTVKINAPAKINLTLGITGKENNYHTLDSVVSTINLFDVITVTSRRDKNINLKTSGLSLEESISAENDNAYLSAREFMQRFGTNGVDIRIKKRIPIGGGLGGSSADIAGTLRAMKLLYDENDEIKAEEIKAVADSLGSDSGYLLTGGFARLYGRGEIVRNIDSNKEFYLVLVVAEGGVNTAECFKRFDDKGLKDESVSSDKVESALLDKEDNYYIEGIGNDLFAPAAEINPEVGRAYAEIKELCPRAVCMSGSGSTVYGIFGSEEMSHWAQGKLKGKFDKVLCCKTASLEKVNKYIM